MTKKIVTHIWYPNDTFHYVLKAEFARLRKFKSPVGSDGGRGAGESHGRQKKKRSCPWIGTYRLTKIRKKTAGGLQRGLFFPGIPTFFILKNRVHSSIFSVVRQAATRSQGRVQICTYLSSTVEFRYIGK